MRDAEFERDGAKVMHNGFATIPCMKPLIARSLLWTGLMALMAVLPLSVQAQSAAPVEVEVSGVKFNYLRQPNSTSAWQEAEIELAAKPAGAGKKFVNRVKVTFSMAVEPTAPGSAKTLDFYRSSAEIITLESGRSFVRFYLPPDVVKRDGLRGDPKGWLVELSVGGTALPHARASGSTTITDRTALESFKSKVTSEAAVNEGVMMPQYLTPYAFDSSRPAPAFLRNEGSR